jgi:hypothetical protein
VLCLFYLDGVLNNKFGKEMNFECLANELLLDLFEYLDGVDLFRAFSGLSIKD